jgi:hypothetical protein
MFEGKWGLASTIILGDLSIHEVKTLLILLNQLGLGIEERVESYKQKKGHALT